MPPPPIGNHAIADIAVKTQRLRPPAGCTHSDDRTEFHSARDCRGRRKGARRLVIGDAVLQAREISEAAE
jgi:hypothetical protein